MGMNGPVEPMRFGFFVLAAFLGAFLIFLVQPMVGKLILPWFGGGPGVWSVCLMFYQGALFLGYLYAYGLVRFVSPRAQVLCHAALLLVALLMLPVLPGGEWKPTGSEIDPALPILAMLVGNVALPFVALSATGPLVQAWFAARFPGRSPYPLYSVSNLGSLSALLLFPLLVEPLLPIRVAGDLWAGGFAGAAVLILVCAVLAARSGTEVSAPDAREEERPLPPMARVYWLLLPACAVILLMAITNKLCLDLASFPFLWIVPLALYLGTFILCFADDRDYSRGRWIVVCLVGLAIEYGLVLLVPKEGPASVIFWSMFVQIPVLSMILFSLCMLLHGELYRLRPSARSLTSFYIGVSGGGALGGIFVALIAPRIFSEYLEVQTGYALAGLLLFMLWRKDETSWIGRGQPGWRPLLVVTSGVAALALGVLGSLDDPEGLLHKERNFFGIHRVIEWEADVPGRHRHVLRHGTTLHGAQIMTDEYRRRPIAYFGIPTGIGLLMHQRDPERGVKVGIVGMGAGSLAAYARPGDRFRFYEIDPAVIEIAKNQDFFTFLKESRGTVDVVPGDGRLSLEAELRAGPPQGFDILVIDAFSSDAIPFHLLTLEAFRLYHAHLAPGGFLAFHISNRHFDLAPIIYRAGSEIGLTALNLENMAFGIRVSTSAEWVFLSEDFRKLETFARRAAQRIDTLGLDKNRISVRQLPPGKYQKKSLWTDDFNSLLDVLGSTK